MIQAKLEVVSYDTLSIKPATFLGGQKFQTYLKATRDAGCAFDASTKTNRVHIRHLPALVSTMAHHDIRLLPDAKTADAVQHFAERLLAQTQTAAAAARDRGLYPFQGTGVNFLASRTRALLADDMGLGKTVQALCALPSYDATGHTYAVVCPAVVKGNWANEIKKWKPELEPVVFKGTKSVRAPEPGEIVILNYELVPANCDWKVDFIIVDETHYLKNSKAKRTINARRLIKNTTLAAWGLTGTPLMNRPPELWGVLQSFGIAIEAYGSWRAFVDAFDGKQGPFGLEWGTNVKPAAVRGLERVMLRRRKTDVLPDLPTKRFQDHHVDDVVVKEAFGDHSDEIELSHVSEYSTLRRELAEVKTPTAHKLADEYEALSEPVVFFSAHKFPIQSLGAREGWASILGDTSHEQRTDIVRRFQAGELRGLACTIQAASVGVTLTRASHMVFVDRSWTPADNWQAEDRICRIGQDRGCLYTFIVANHPLDVRVNALLEAKRALIEKSVEKALPRDTNAEELMRLAQLMQESLAEPPQSQPVQEWAKENRYRSAASDDEKWTEKALLFLSACDGDRASSANGQGFNKTDTDFGNDLAAQLQRGSGLTDKQWAAAARLCRKYRKQVERLGVS